MGFRAYTSTTNTNIIDTDLQNPHQHNIDGCARTSYHSGSENLSEENHSTTKDLDTSSYASIKNGTHDNRAANS